MYGEAIKSARLKANLTQKEVAEVLQISQPTLANWERDKRSAPSVKRLTELADIYNVSLDELLGRR